jgi:hypothetical protein
MFHARLKGRDLHSPTNEIVENKSGSTIPALKVVRLDGQVAAYPNILLADPNSYINFGVTYDAIDNDKNGLACVFGFMVDVDTSTWPAMTSLYSDASGNLTTTSLGGLVAVVIKQDASSGILYVTTESSAASSGSNSWRLLGNGSTNPAINFIGTTDLKPLKIRTDNNFRAIIDENGRFGLGPDIESPQAHFHQKSHTGFSNSGLRKETYSLTTSTNANSIAFTIPINQNSVVKVEFHAIGRVSDGSDRAAFKRTGLFYRQASNVSTDRKWQTDFTDKSNPGFDVSYTMGVNQLIIYVKSSTNTDTYWTGHVEIESIETDV